MMKIKLLTLNMHKGKFARGKGSNVEPLLNQSKLLNADLILLQEACDREDEETEAQCCKLATSLNMDHRYGLNASREFRNHGNTTLSKFQILDSHNLNITKNRFEYRGVLYTKIKLNNDIPLHVFNTHFSLTFLQRKKQFHLLQSHIRKIVKENEPIVVAGDFNDFKGKVHHLFTKEGGFKDVFEESGHLKVATFPSAKPWFRLDHIYFKNMRFVSSRLMDDASWQNLSDHLGIFCELEI